MAPEGLKDNTVAQALDYVYAQHEAQGGGEGLAHGNSAAFAALAESFGIDNRELLAVAGKLADVNAPLIETKVAEPTPRDFVMGFVGSMFMAGVQWAREQEHGASS